MKKTITIIKKQVSPIIIFIILAYIMAAQVPSGGEVSFGVTPLRVFILLAYGGIVYSLRKIGGIEFDFSLKAPLIFLGGLVTSLLVVCYVSRDFYIVGSIFLKSLTIELLGMMLGILATDFLSKHIVSFIETIRFKLVSLK